MASQTVCGRPDHGVRARGSPPDPTLAVAGCAAGRGVPTKSGTAFRRLAGVGGDFADFFTLPDGQVGLYLGDVVGKGLSAALYAALVMGLLRGIHKDGNEPGRALTLLNKRMLVRPVVGRFAVTLYATFDPASRKFTSSQTPDCRCPCSFRNPAARRWARAGCLPAFFPACLTKTIPPSFRPVIPFCSQATACTSFATATIKTSAANASQESGSSLTIDRRMTRSTLSSTKHAPFPKTAASSATTLPRSC